MARVIEGVVSDDENAERQARNLMRAQAAIVALGPRWVGWLPPKEVPAEAKNVTTIKARKQK